MPGFHKVLFPTDIAMGAVGGPGFKTDVLSFPSGQEQRHVRWEQSRLAWDVSQAIKTQEEMNRLVAFFRNRRGKAYGFLFKDWTDYKASRGRIFIGNGVSTEIRLSKVYRMPGTYIDYDPAIGEEDWTTRERRYITRPVEGSLKLWVDGTLSAGWSCNYDTGRITFLDPPPEGTDIEAEFEFYVPVRFDIDQMKYSMDDYDIYTWGQILIVEIKDDGS